MAGWSLSEMSYQANPQLDAAVMSLGRANVLDIGGWYAPYPLATHVVDVMPYETRGGGDPQPGEKFTRETWIQADITSPDFRLPYPDKYFDFCVFMNTAEDLHEFRTLMREISRACKQGFIETPTRLLEQTIGISDRSCRRVGYNHHKWIVDVEGATLKFYDKLESFYQPAPDYVVPLSFTESCNLPEAHQVFWNDHISFEICNDSHECRRVAREFRKQLPVRRSDILKDRCLRYARRVRNVLRGVSEYPTEG